MSRVLFTVSYEIPEGSREKYLGLIAKLKDILNADGISYSVFEVEKARNQFKEVYIYPSEEAYEASDDAENAEADDLVQQIYSMVKDKKVHYAHAIEI